MHDFVHPTRNRNCSIHYTYQCSHILGHIHNDLTLFSQCTKSITRILSGGQIQLVRFCARHFSINLLRPSTIEHSRADINYSLHSPCTKSVTKKNLSGRDYDVRFCARLLDQFITFVNAHIPTFGHITIRHYFRLNMHKIGYKNSQRKIFIIMYVFWCKKIGYEKSQQERLTT